MTTIAEGTLTDALQALVDARLDTIDRMLLGRVNRHDRLAIVREVESQVFDLLRRHEGGPIDRDDVLAVLARLDPPEAYLPEEGSTAEARPRQASVGPRAFPNPGDAQPSRLDLAGGVLGLVSLSVLLLGVLLVLMNLDEIVFPGIARAWIRPQPPGHHLRGEGRAPDGLGDRGARHRLALAAGLPGRRRVHLDRALLNAPRAAGGSVMASRTGPSAIIEG